MDEVLQEIGSLGIVPVANLDRPALAASTLGALKDGGLPIVQIGLRDAHAIEAIREAATVHPDAIVGAGSVTTAEQVAHAADAGARFVSCTGVSEKLVKEARRRGLLALPECADVQALEHARDLGLKCVLFSPAESSGGVAMLTALASLCPGMVFVAMGGIHATNMHRYLMDGRVLAVGVSWMVEPDLVRSRDWAAVTSLARDAARQVHGFALAHVGLSTDDEADAMAVASRFAALFGFEVKVGNSSIFASPAIEVVKGPSRGRFGHLAIRTANIPRAVAYLGRNGFAIDRSSEKRGPDGSIKAVYLAEEVGGFALHLLQE